MSGADTRQYDELRRRAQELELDLVRLLDDRAEIAQRLRATSEGAAPGEVDEAAWLAHLEQVAGGHLPPESLRAILREVRAALRGIGVGLICSAS